MRNLFLAALFAGLPLTAEAQALTAAEIAAMVDEAHGGYDEYAALLNDPNPQRARLAMKIMLEQGDPELSRMALDFGLYSIDASVRRMALEGFFSGKPAITATLDGKAFDEKQYVARVIYHGGSVVGTATGNLHFKIAGYDDEAQCYLAGRVCLLRLSDAGVSFQLDNHWTEFKLDENGVLNGSIFLSGVGSVPALIEITP